MKMTRMVLLMVVVVMTMMVMIMMTILLVMMIMMTIMMILLVMMIMMTIMIMLLVIMFPRIVTQHRPHLSTSEYHFLDAVSPASSNPLDAMKMFSPSPARFAACSSLPVLASRLAQSCASRARPLDHVSAGTLWWARHLLCVSRAERANESMMLFNTGERSISISLKLLPCKPDLSMEAAV